MIDAFPTPIYRFSTAQHAEYASLDSELLQAILLEEQTKERTEAYSLKGRNGWHSPDDLCERDTAWSHRLEDLIYEITSNYLEKIGGTRHSRDQVQVKAWAMVMRDGDYSTVHTHPYADICGCYYLQVPDELPKNEGNIVFLDPRGGARGSRMFGSNSIAVKPEVGLGIVFPNWLEHYVESHFTGGTRVSIAWNYYVTNP